MATPRSMIVDESRTSRYHCISRCVRHSFFCGQAAEQRRGWIEHWIQELGGIFAIECAGFVIVGLVLSAM
jgi:hypothetical protein